MTSLRRNLGGFAVIAALFLIVGLAALGAFMVNFSNTQQLTSAQDVSGTRAYWAARAGLEWVMTAASGASACPAASSTLSVEGFSVKVGCTVTSYAEAGNTVKLFQFTSVANVGTVGSINYIERSVSASMEK